jgi:hypothetical protein
MKIIVRAGATKSITAPFPRWKATAQIVAFFGFGALRARISTPCIGKRADDMKASKLSASVRFASDPAPWLRNGAGYLLAVAVVGTELIARITLVMLH